MTSEAHDINLRWTIYHQNETETIAVLMMETCQYYEHSTWGMKYRIGVEMLNIMLITKGDYVGEERPEEEIKFRACT